MAKRRCGALEKQVRRIVVLCINSLAALRRSTGGANKAAFLINQRLIATVRALLSASLHAVRQIFFKSTLNPHLPSIYALRVKLKSANKLQHLVNGHNSNIQD